MKEYKYQRTPNAPEMEAGGLGYNPEGWRYRLFSFDKKIEDIERLRNRYP
jgi:hypothetical protein